MVVVVFGLPGSGKSFLAKKLAVEIGASYLGTDLIRGELNQVRDYSFIGRKKVYEQMMHMARGKLDAGEDIVLDGTFYLESLRQLITEILGEDVEICYIEVIASEELIKKRTEVERQDSDADFQVYQELKQTYEPLKEPHLKLMSSDDNIDHMLSEAVDYIGINEKKV